MVKVTRRKRTAKKTAPTTPPKYIIWNPTSDRPPQVEFNTEEDARRIAAHMARRYGDQFYVMKAVCLVEKQPVPVQVTEF